MVDPIRNLGPVSREWMRAVDVNTLADLKRLGSVKVYKLIKNKGLPVSLNLLYALEGAIRDVPWHSLPPDTRESLKASR